MLPALAPAQLELLRHCFRYNDASPHYRSKLSVAEIQDLVQCGHAIVSRKRKLWDKTGDVEKLCKRPGRPKSLDHILEECLVVFSQEKDTLSTLERISEARIARHGLPAGLMTRLKDSIKTWRRAAS